MGSLPVMLVWCLLRQTIGVDVSTVSPQAGWAQIIAARHRPGVVFVQGPPLVNLTVLGAGRPAAQRDTFVIEGTITPAWKRYDATTLEGGGPTAHAALEMLADRIAEWMRKRD